MPEARLVTTTELMSSPIAPVTKAAFPRSPSHFRKLEVEVDEGAHRRASARAPRVKPVGLVWTTESDENHVSERKFGLGSVVPGIFQGGRVAMEAGEARVAPLG